MLNLEYFLFVNDLDLDPVTFSSVPGEVLDRVHVDTDCGEAATEGIAAGGDERFYQRSVQSLATQEFNLQTSGAINMGGQKA